MRVEDVDADSLGPVDAVTARAFAPLSTTIALAKVWLDAGGGRRFPARPVGAETSSRGRLLASAYAIDIVPSVVDKDAAILLIRQRPKA